MARVWIGSWASYNAGRLHGAWLDVSDSDTMREEISAIMAADPEHGEEWGVFDSEGLGDLVKETADIEEICAMAELCDEYGAALVTGIMDHYGRGYLDAAGIREVTREQYRGCYKSVSDFAYELAQDIHGDRGLGPLANYIDWDSYGRDLEFGGDIFTVETGYNEVHVFWNN